MKIVFLFIAIFVYCHQGFASPSFLQDSENSSSKTRVIDKEKKKKSKKKKDIDAPDVLPTFNNKDNVTQLFSTWVNQNMEYPTLAVSNDIQGRVLVHLTVHEDGKVSAEIKKTRHPLLDEEAIRVVESSNGLWTPAMDEGKPVKYSYDFPVTFKLKNVGKTGFQTSR